MRDLRRGIRRLFHLGLWGPEVDEGVDWEIEHHILERADELESQGLTRAEALKQARQNFGDVEAVRRELRILDEGQARQRRMGLWLERLWQDVRYGLRGIRRNPGFSATLVLTLGLGIGVTVAVFGIVDALLLRPLPYADSGELVQVEVKQPGADWSNRYLSFEVVGEWSELDMAFGGMLPHRRSSSLYTGGREPLNVTAHRVAPSFEEVLGVRPTIGRGFLSEDAAPGAAPVALISNGFWRSAFGGDPEVVGAQVDLDGVPHTVVGIMPAGFKFPQYSTTEFWVPLGEDATVPWVEVVARVPLGNMAAAESRANTQTRALFSGRPGLDSATVSLSSLEAARGGTDEIRRAVWLLFGAVGLILLMAVMNGFNLLLVRGAARTREIAVRLSLGASRSRVIRQLMTETLVLAALSGSLAVLFGVGALQAVQGLLPDGLVFFLPHALGVEGRAIAVSFVVALVAGLVLGLFPAIRSTHSARATAREGFTPYAAHTPARSRLRRGLVVGEVAVSVVLLVGAGLLLNSFLRLIAVDIGVQTENVAFVNLPLSPEAHPDSAARSTFLSRLEERIGAIPGVEAATATGSLPSSGLSFGTVLQAEGHPPSGGDPDVLPTAEVSPLFFDVLGARLLAGRPFHPRESAGEVAIVDEDLARHLWPAGGAVGQRFRFGERSPWLTVVGVVADIQLTRRDKRDGDFEILLPFDPSAAVGQATLAFRTSGDPTRLFPFVRAAVRELAPNQPILELIPAGTAYGETLQIPRFLAVLVAALAGVALALAAVGLFGILAYEVAQRGRELGVRLAIGARASELQAMVVREGLLLALLGSVIGLGAALGLSRFIRGILFDLEPTDPVTLITVLALIMLTATAATYLPARRATRVDPAEVLRAD